MAIIVRDAINLLFVTMVTDFIEFIITIAVIVTLMIGFVLMSVL